MNRTTRLHHHSLSVPMLQLQLRMHTWATMDNPSHIINSSKNRRDDYLNHTLLLSDLKPHSVTLLTLDEAWSP